MKRIISLAIVLAILLTALAFSEGMWTCTSCGSSGNTGNFCTNCGAKRQDESWTCPSCGTSGNVSNFCPNCGTRRPENTAVLAADANAEADWNVGDTVLFGSYEQDGDASGNSEPIEWLVLEVNDHDALLLSKKALVCHAYHDVNEEVTWESCTLRQWLNGSFMDSAFTAAERENILPSHVEDAPNPSFGTPAGNATEDYVYLLSIGEAERYLPEADDRFCVPTVCAMDDGPLTSSDYLSNGEMSCDWWLRSPGYSGNCAADVYVDGYIYAEGLPVDSLGCVRPVTRVCYPLNVKKTEEVKTSTPVPQVTIQPTLVPTATPAPTNTPTPQPTNAIGTGTNGYAIGDIVTFGTYPQTAEGNDDTPIEWIVLDKDGDNYLLISKFALDYQSYNNESAFVSWETCSLREWLNNEFFNRAFSSSEKTQITRTIVKAEDNQRYPDIHAGNDTVDNVFLLSLLEKYHYSYYGASKCGETDYAVAVRNFTVFGNTDKDAYDRPTCVWWLRSPGKSEEHAAFVEFDGAGGFYGFDVNSTAAVRPCIWVSNPAGKVPSGYNVSVLNRHIGDVVTFGSYPQTAKGNDDTPIEWIVLTKDGDEYLLISRLILDCQPYNTIREDVSWENCTLRKWLNENFYNRAFNNAQKSQIVNTLIVAEDNEDYSADYELGNDTMDNVLLLNNNPVSRYYAGRYMTLWGDNGAEHNMEASEYARSHDPYDNDVYTNSYGNMCLSGWWFSSPYCMNKGYGACARDSYLEYYSSQVDGISGVRPCIWVRLDESVFSGAASATEEASTTERPSFQTETASASTVSGAGTLSMPSGKTVFGSPEYSANIICRTTGDDLKYISYDNGWYYVILPDGSCGYVNENGCKVEQYAESDLDRKPTSKDKYGTLKIDAGTNIRSSSSTNSSVVLTTVVNKTYKYVSCENGWYKIILDDGSYAYVYYTRATVSERAPGDNGTYGIKPTSGSSSSSGSGSGSGTGGSGSQRDPSCDDPDISKHKLFYRGQKTECPTPELGCFTHYVETYKYYSCSCGKNTTQELISKIRENHTYVWNSTHEYHICSKCGIRLLDEGWSDY